MNRRTRRFTKGLYLLFIAVLLAGLANNGGPTQTHALQADSPAIDAVTSCTIVSTSTAPAPNDADATVTTDQRGVTRSQGNDCDIGAYEWPPTGGGIVVPVNKLGLVAPWMGLVGLVSLAALTIAVVRRRRGWKPIPTIRSQCKRFWRMVRQNLLF